MTSKGVGQIVLAALLSLRLFSAGEAQDTEARSLELGKPIERELAGGQAHSYQIQMLARQYLQVIVERRGIDVVLAVFEPDGKKLADVDTPNGTQGPKPVSLVTGAAGSYRLEVRSLENEAAGRYEVKIAELRNATSQDDSRIAAERAVAEGEQLRGQVTAEALRRSIEKFEAALPHWRVVGDHQREADTLNNIGLVYSDLWEQQKALEYYQQAMLLRRTAGDLRGEAASLNNISAVYRNLGDGQKALDYLQQALPLRRAASDLRGEALTLNNIGVAYSDLGEKQKALDLFLQVLPLRRALDDRPGEAATLLNIGSTYSDLGEQQKALEHYFQALVLRRALGNRQGEAAALLNIGSVYSDLGEQQKALEYYRQALPLWQALGRRDGEAETLYGIARAERNGGNLGEARLKIEAALNIIEALRAAVAGQELRASYLAFKHEYYEFYIDLLMRLDRRDPGRGFDTLALEASEYARARSLLDTLAEARIDIRQGIDTALLERERSLQRQLNEKEQYRMGLLSGKHSPEQAITAEKEVSALTTQYQELQAQIRVASPRYAALTQPQPLGLKEIQHEALDADTLLLEYALGDDRSFLWAISPTSVTSFELPKRADIEAQARRFYESLTAQTSSEAAAALSQMLLGPVASQLGTKRLLIVAEGALQYVPFAALPNPATPNSALNGRQPLVANHEIVSLPSASTLAVLRREMAERKPAPKSLAILADPVFGSDDSRVRRSQAGAGERANPSLVSQVPTRAVERPVERSARETGITGTGLRIPRLPGTRQEATTILALVPEADRKQAFDFEASRATVTNPELSQYRIIHFATHGLLNSEHPELSGVVLSLVDRQGQPQDGFLRLYEIYNLRLPAELVVLSACQTGLGREIKGEGLVGLTRGFMYAGAPRVVASLWKVDDKATAELMKRFYSGMLGAERMRPAAALRAAQVAMSKTKGWEDPYYWAGFVLQGEWK